MNIDRRDVIIGPGTGITWKINCCGLLILYTPQRPLLIVDLSISNIDPDQQRTVKLNWIDKELLCAKTNEFCFVTFAL